MMDITKTTNERKIQNNVQLAYDIELDTKELLTFYKFY